MCAYAERGEGQGLGGERGSYLIELVTVLRAGVG